MIQQPCNDQSITRDESECDTCKESAESEVALPNTNTAASPPIQQSAVDLAHQHDIRPESVNPVIHSSTAKLVVDSGCFGHCCPLDFATQFGLNEGRFLNASAADTIRLKHCGTGGLDKRRDWSKDSAQDQIQRV